MEDEVLLTRFPSGYCPTCLKGLEDCTCLDGVEWQFVSVIKPCYTSLTMQQKLDTLALRYYQGWDWKPKKSDYYTTSRADLELYQIVDEDENNFYTNYCDESKRTENPATWTKDEFLKDFGVRRCHVPEFILNE